MTSSYRRKSRTFPINVSGASYDNMDGHTERPTACLSCSYIDFRTYILLNPQVAETRFYVSSDHVYPLSPAATRKLVTSDKHITSADHVHFPFILPHYCFEHRRSPLLSATSSVLLISRSVFRSHKPPLPHKNPFHHARRGVFAEIMPDEANFQWHPFARVVFCLPLPFCSDLPRSCLVVSPYTHAYARALGFILSNIYIVVAIRIEVIGSDRWSIGVPFGVSFRDFPAPGGVKGVGQQEGIEWQ